MSFTINDKDYSDKEMYNAIQATKQERRQWCQQQAREFLEKKERQKYYHCWYLVPEVEDDSYIRLSQEDVDCIQKAIKENEEKGLSEAEADEERREVIHSLQIDLSSYIYDPYEYADLTDVHFDDFIYCYGFRVKLFDNEGNETSTTNKKTRLSDDEYIQILTELLYTPQQLSFEGLRRILPELCTKIMNDITEPHETAAVFMTEFNADVEAILKPIGGRDSIPGSAMFNNPFFAIAEHLAERNDKGDTE